MIDQTESTRRKLVYEINSSVESDDKTSERGRLEVKYGDVWNTDEVSRDFEISGFMAPFAIARRKEDGQKGSLMFQDRPRFYFNFKEVI